MGLGLGSVVVVVVIVVLLLVGSVGLEDGTILDVVGIIVVGTNGISVVIVIVNVLGDVGVLSMATRVFVMSTVRVMSVVFISVSTVTVALMSVMFIVNVGLMMDKSLVGIIVVVLKVDVSDVDALLEVCAAVFRWLLKTTSNDSTKTVHFMLPSVWSTVQHLTKTQSEVNNNVSFSIRRL